MKFGIYRLIIESFESNLEGMSEDLIFLLKRNKVLEKGWGNGYIFLPPNHPFYKKHYDSIPVSVHGGLTFGKIFDSSIFLKWIDDRYFEGDVTLENYKKLDGYWIIGFDTGHAGDNLIEQSKEFLMKETDQLLEQCLDDDIKGIKKYKTPFLRKDKLKVIELSIKPYKK